MEGNRKWLAIMGARQLLIGAALLFEDGELQSSPTLHFVYEVAPDRAWGTLLVIVGVLCIGAALAPLQDLFRPLILTSVVISAMWAACALMGWLNQPNGTLVGVAVFGTFAAKDLLFAFIPHRQVVL